jgi:hypothetical protein
VGIAHVASTMVYPWAQENTPIVLLRAKKAVKDDTDTAIIKII